jgi:hypothetical protein
LKQAPTFAWQEPAELQTREVPRSHKSALGLDFPCECFTSTPGEDRIYVVQSFPVRFNQLCRAMHNVAKKQRPRGL